jgi:murein L,D-transpeptidase YcbB/YkuD
MAVVTTLVVLQCCHFTAYADDVSDAIRAGLANIESVPQYSSRAREDLQRFYALREFRSAWDDEAAVTALQTLAQSAGEGLNPRHYQISPVTRPSDASKAALWDIQLSDNFLRYARDVHVGQLAPNDVYPDVDLPIRRFDAASELNSALTSRSLASLIAALPPQREEYAFLRSALVQYRALVSGTGADTNRARQRVWQIVANMERWRWLPDRPDDSYIEVNAADASLKVVADGESIVTSRVIVGKPNWKTPVLATSVAGLVLNPPWNIPGPIAEREIWPKVVRNPGYLAAHHMQLHDGAIQQMPGDKGALGAILLDMPNRFDVYLHDTPSKKLFASSDRFLSHGCVRVQNIRAVAGFALTGDAAGDLTPWFPVDRSETRRIPLSRRLPIYIVYWTVFRNSDATTAFRRDVYGRDIRLLEKLGYTGVAQSLQRSAPDSGGKRKASATQRYAEEDEKSLAGIDVVAARGLPGVNARKRPFDLRRFFTADSLETSSSPTASSR